MITKRMQDLAGIHLNEVTLSDKEKVALARFHLGGVEALRTSSYSADTNTINSLFRKKLMDKHGLTDQGKKLAKEFADKGLI